MQVCSKAGKIAKLDYLFHKSGPLRGKPRGYAFVEYQSVDVSRPPSLSILAIPLTGWSPNGRTR